jgi:integrase/recombinase XerD
MLGHVSLETTQIYTQVSIRALVNVHATTHPAAGLARPSKKEEENEAEPTEDDLHAALDAEVEADPEK